MIVLKRVAPEIVVDQSGSRTRRTRVVSHGVKATNDAIRFLVELAPLAAVCYWGLHNHSSWAAKIVLGIGAPLLMAAVWAVWMAPQSEHRMAERGRVLIELVIFGSPNTRKLFDTRAGRAASSRC